MGTLACSGKKTAHCGEEIWGDRHGIRLISKQIREKQNNLAWISQWEITALSHPKWSMKTNGLSATGWRSITILLPQAFGLVLMEILVWIPTDWGIVILARTTLVKIIFTQNIYINDRAQCNIGNNIAFYNCRRDKQIKKVSLTQQDQQKHFKISLKASLMENIFKTLQKVYFFAYFKVHLVFSVCQCTFTTIHYKNTQTHNLISPTESVH